MISYPKLKEHEKEQVLRNLEIRRARFEHFILQGKKPTKKFPRPEVVIIGDRPGPSAPQDPDYHHTPFYSTKHCSGWLNALLWEWGIDENRLLWLNAYDKDGVPTDDKLLENNAPNSQFPSIIVLGGNAEKWVKKNGWTSYMKVDHPQYHKRFKNKERYDLPLVINDCLDFVPDSLLHS